MSGSLLARKGEAVPSGLNDNHRHAFAYFADRRTVAFDKVRAAATIATLADSPLTAASPRQRPAASILIRPRNRRDGRKRFTFRVDDSTHDQFCRAAQMLSCSRQKLLRTALDHYLQVLGIPETFTTNSAPSVPRLV